MLIKYNDGKYSIDFASIAQLKIVQPMEYMNSVIE